MRRIILVTIIESGDDNLITDIEITFLRHNNTNNDKNENDKPYIY